MSVKREYRCACGKLLCKGLLLMGTIEIKCRRCGTLQTFEER
ncbi:Com family DNA-binding transcriptional regulator [Patescibacteria group bacterium]|nr:Com family DNA-binding transcriptional regulator [Patescibacteria group bacterium]